jgi:hypothetical protein
MQPGCTPDMLVKYRMWADYHAPVEDTVIVIGGIVREYKGMGLWRRRVLGIGSGRQLED